MRIIEKEEKPSPAWLQAEIIELALALLLAGNKSVTKEKAKGFTAELIAPYKPLMRANTAKELTAPATPKVNEASMIVKAKKSFLFTLCVSFPAMRPQMAKGTVYTKPTNNP